MIRILHVHVYLWEQDALTPQPTVSDNIALLLLCGVQSEMLHKLSLCRLKFRLWDCIIVVCAFLISPYSMQSGQSHAIAVARGCTLSVLPRVGSRGATRWGQWHERTTQRPDEEGYGIRGEHCGRGTAIDTQFFLSGIASFRISPPSFSIWHPLSSPSHYIS